MSDLEKKIEEIKAEITKLKKRVVALEHPGAVAQVPLASRVKELSPREFLNEYTANNDVERVLLFGFFLEHYQNKNLFNIDDLRELFYATKMKPPANINDKINMNIKKGYIMNTPDKKGDKKTWVLTRKGEDYTNSIKKEIG